MDRPRSRPRRLSECVGGLSEQEHRHASQVHRSRSTTEAAPKVAKPSKIAAVIEKAKTVGITMAEVKAMTGWSKTGGFYGAIKRAGLTLTKDANGAYHAA
jgi:hypothetical protein